MTSILRDDYDGLLLDLDGVVYIGPDSVPGAVSSLNSAAESGLRLGYVTNNAARPAVEVAEHLSDLGLDCLPENVVTSAQIAAAIVVDRLGETARVLCVGGPGIAIAVQALGATTVESAQERPDAVVQGFGPKLRWVDLAEAGYAIQAGALWVATNTDLTIPQTRGVAPGCGSLVNAVRQAVDVDPIVAGKPQPVAFTTAAQRIRADRPLVVGDRLDTDIAGGAAAGFDTLMVLTGVHGVDELLTAGPAERPTMVAVDLTALAEPRPPTDVEGWASTSGEARVELVDGVLTQTRGPAGLSALRATLALAWAAVDAGREWALAPALASRIRTVGPGR